MVGNKDSEEVANFMALFHRLRDLVRDDPGGIAKAAEADASFKLLCDKLEQCSNLLSRREKREGRLFIRPVSSDFIEAWRDYEAHYKAHVDDVAWAPLVAALAEEFPAAPGSASEERVDDWTNADLWARHESQAFAAVLAFAKDQVSDPDREFPEQFSDEAEQGLETWRRLTDELRFDLQGVLRRWDLAPVTLIPGHVSSHYGDEKREKLSLIARFDAATQAFLFGIPLAALALMRAVLESVLRMHYNSQGRQISEQIRNCAALAQADKTNAQRLVDLANDILHAEQRIPRVPDDLEREVLRLLVFLRSVIERAPGPIAKD